MEDFGRDTVNRRKKEVKILKGTLGIVREL